MAELRPALIGSAALHLGAVLAGVLVWPAHDDAPRPPPVPVTLVSAPTGLAAAAGPPADAPPAETPAPAQPVAEAPPEPAPPEPAPVTPPPRPSPPAPPKPAPPTPPPPAPPRTAAPSAKPAPPATKPAPPAARPAPQPPRQTAQPARPAPEPGLDLGALRNKLARARPAPTPPVGGGGGISAADLAAAQAGLVARLEDLWNPNCEVEGAERVNVRVRFHIGEDGRVDGQPEVVGGLSSDGVVRAAQESAVRAVMAGQPYTWLPKEALGVSYAPRFNGEQACRG